MGPATHCERLGPRGACCRFLDCERPVPGLTSTANEAADQAKPKANGGSSACRPRLCGIEQAGQTDGIARHSCAYKACRCRWRCCSAHLSVQDRRRTRMQRAAPCREVNCRVLDRVKPVLTSSSSRSHPRFRKGSNRVHLVQTGWQLTRIPPPPALSDAGRRKTESYPCVPHV